MEATGSDEVEGARRMEEEAVWARARWSGGETMMAGAMGDDGGSDRRGRRTGGDGAERGILAKFWLSVTGVGGRRGYSAFDPLPLSRFVMAPGTKGPFVPGANTNGDKRAPFYPGC